jgi:hypothetical protein
MLHGLFVSFAKGIEHSALSMFVINNSFSKCRDTVAHHAHSPFGHPHMAIFAEIGDSHPLKIGYPPTMVKIGYPRIMVNKL